MYVCVYLSVDVFHSANLEDQHLYAAGATVLVLILLTRLRPRDTRANHYKCHQQAAMNHVTRNKQVSWEVNSAACHVILKCKQTHVASIWIPGKAYTEYIRGSK